MPTTTTGTLSGSPQVYTQFSANGHGPATLKVPMSTSGFRNLSNFSSIPIKGGYAEWHLNLNGTTSQRSMAHFPTRKLPLHVSVAYEFNGRRVKAQDVVGKTGTLKATYVITNVTTRPTKVTFKNVFGKQETTTVNAPVPIAAQLAVTVPSNWTHLSGPNASASGNGNGTTSATWSLFLFDPAGGVKQSVTYQAHVTDAVVPSATLSAAVLPPTTAQPLPTVTVPGAPAVPVYTLGGILAKLQNALNGARAQLAALASRALAAYQKVVVPALFALSARAKTVAGNLPAASARAAAVSTDAHNASTALAQAATNAADASTRSADLGTRLAQRAVESVVAAGLITNLRGALAQRAVESVVAAGLITNLHGALDQAAAQAAATASQIADVRTRLEGLPPELQATPAFRILHARVVVLEGLLKAHAVRLALRAARARALQVLLVLHAARLSLSAARAHAFQVLLVLHAARLAVTAIRARVLGVRLTVLSRRLTRRSFVEAHVLAPLALRASTALIGLVPTAKAVSAGAAKAATTLAAATVSPRKHPPVPTKQVGGGAQLDKAVAQLDAAIVQTGNKVNNSYAYLTALNKRAAANQLPAGNAVGTKHQVGAFVYSVAGANNSNNQTNLANFIGGLALLIGIGLGISVYRIRRGLPSSMASPKKSPAPAKG